MREDRVLVYSTDGTLPLFRKLHNGNWAVIFGNGFGSTRQSAG